MMYANYELAYLSFSINFRARGPTVCYRRIIQCIIYYMKSDLGFNFLICVAGMFRLENNASSLEIETCQAEDNST